MLSSITILEEIHLCYTNITRIPSLAFKPISGTQNNLTFITFAYSSIVEKRDNAFSALSNLSYLSFASNRIESIPKTAFNFENDSEEIMQLDL
jgi:Leucine-rich repeat (LRR) protein